MENFKDYLKKIEEGQEFINESVLPSKLINHLIRYETQKFEPMNGQVATMLEPSMNMLADCLGIQWDDNLVDNKDFLQTYELVKSAFNKAKTAYLVTLNKELKGIK